MNINFKTNLVAILAFATATALGSDPCLGVQSHGNANSAAIGTGIVKPIASSHPGDIDAAASAPENDYFRRRELPPIVRPSQAKTELPPIVNARQANEPVAKRRAPIFRPEKVGVLAPIKQQVSSKSNATGIDPTMAPPTIIQASNASGDTADGSRVAQAAQWGPNHGYVRTATSSAGVPLYPRASTAQVPAATTASGVPLYPRVATAPPVPPVVNNKPPGVPPIISPNSQLVSPGSSNYSAPPVASVAATPASYAPRTSFAPTSPASPDPSYAPSPTSYSQGSGSASFAPAQGSGTTGFAPPQGSGTTGFAPAPPQGSGTTGFAPAPVQGSATVNQSPTFSPQYFSGPPVEAPVVSSPVCNDCGGGGCSNCGIASAAGGGFTSNCQQCGNNGCFNAAQVASRAGISGLVPAARRYLLADALLFTRTDGDGIVNSNFGSLDGFDFNGGLRLTFGAKSDSLRGREITYEGIAPVTESETRESATGLISTAITPFGGLPATSTSAFQNVTSQTESQSAEFHSLEFNRVTYGWDVIKSFGGFRIIYLDDDYQTTTTNIFGETGDFELAAINNLFGVHIGGEIFYDIGRRLSYSLASKAGVFLNFSQVDTRLTNNGIDFIDDDDDNATFSTSIELSALAHYQLSQTSRFRIGYNVLFIGEVATAQDNFNPVLTPTSASQTDDGDDIVFHGLNFGFEIFR